MRLQVALLFLVYTEGKKKSKVSDDAVIDNLDVFPAPFPSPVPFGHIFKDGIGDVVPGLKQPVDLLELDLFIPTRDEQDKYLKKLPKQNIIRINNNPIEFANPRDKYLRFNLNQAEEIAREGVTTSPNKTDDRPQWFNFEVILERNFNTPRPAVALAARTPKPDRFDENSANGPDQEIQSNDVRKRNYFSAHTYSLLKDPHTAPIYDHWTTCDQFERKTRKFHPKDIVDLDWIPFYVWTTRHFVVSVVHRFSFPTKKTVREYRQTYGPHINKTVYWENPKLLLKEDMELLLIAADRNGLFHGIPRLKIPSNFKFDNNTKFPVITMRIKIEDPYLAMMFCDEYYAVIMATTNSGPLTDEEKTEEATIINFKGTGFPVSRDLELEDIKKKGEIEQRHEEEETKYIKVLDTGFEIERE
ncbi:uncharacterized protein LOC135082304 [Ostrinia nubilalis]|uniref:uncharacterized protein LOC135082304 n=1 Tax=Ostrinia nubilalis TaxID=29057 RepID=UPI0030824A13